MSFLRYLGTNFILLLAISIDACVIGILLNKPNGVREDDHVWLVYYSNLLLAFLAIIFFLRLTYLQVAWGRKKRYVLAFNILNQGFAELHELERSESPEPLIKFNYLEKFSDALAQTFSHITNAQCSVCIKVLSEYNNRLEVWTLVRDSVSNNSRPLQKKDKAKNLHHWVDANTDFITIIQNMASAKKPYFCCNNLLWLNGYKNTRIADNSKQVSNNFTVSQFHKMRTWPLPYRSSFVVPIIPGYFNSNRYGKLAGFLCIDSQQTGIFKEKYDLSIIQGVADGLYNVLVKYYDLFEYNVH